MLEDGFETLRFELVLDPVSGIGIAISSDGHSVERIGAALEDKGRKIPFLQSLRKGVRVVFMLHRGHLKDETGEA